MDKIIYKTVVVSLSNVSINKRAQAIDDVGGELVAIDNNLAYIKKEFIATKPAIVSKTNKKADSLAKNKGVSIRCKTTKIKKKK